MFAHERHEEILKMLRGSDKVTVKELCSFFKVTEDCIRKDLNKLEKEGKLTRTYGGAISVRKSAEIALLPERITENLDIKKKIAQKAFLLLKDGDTIFLDISTTNILLAQLIANSPLRLTIITNMIDIINAFGNCTTSTMICTGGVYKPNINGFVGSSVNAFIAQYNFDKVFIGICGINVSTNALTTMELEEGISKKTIMDAGKKAYVVMENRKFQFDGPYIFTSLEKLTGIITEGQPDFDIANSLEEKNILLL